MYERRDRMNVEGELYKAVTSNQKVAIRLHNGEIITGVQKNSQPLVMPKSGRKKVLHGCLLPMLNMFRGL
ncbi:hypothetical protein PMSD_23105 [Paenibacillus macquariensis subsp. defensor]|nr:hypothetical protein PMSD_23105 [Paenibacillus macquariensis subsp. defensor]